jgi:hypothetical protein
VGHVEDPIRRWKREAEELEAERREAKREARRAERLRANEHRRSQAADADGWEAWLRVRLDDERSFMVEVVGQALGQEREQVLAELTRTINKLEGENAILRAMLVEKLGEMRSEIGKTALELGRRLATVENAAAKTLKRLVDEHGRELFAWRHPR